MVATPSIVTFDRFAPVDELIGIGNANPNLSWTLRDVPKEYIPKGYCLEITRGSKKQAFEATSDQSLFVEWPDRPLESRESAAVRVRVRDESGWGDWSPISVVEAGLLSPEEWRAEFISPVEIGGLDQPAPTLDKQFELPNRVKSARVYATAHGVYDLKINGKAVTDEVLAPGWTSYSNRLRYQTYDVTDILRVGENRLNVTLGNGWYRGYLSFLGERATYGDRLAACVQLEVTLESGEKCVIVTDESWKAFESQIVRDELYHGTTIDLGRSLTEVNVYPVEIVPSETKELVAPDGPPIRQVGVLPAQKIWTSPKGKTLIDFGQNGVGWVRLKIKGVQPGTEIVMRHAEVLEHEELGTRPLRAARATDTYIVDSTMPQSLEPIFTIHGFRYAEVSGLPNLQEDDIEFVVVGSDLERVGWFSCSVPELNRLHENVVWSSRSNFVDIPTDCPQRDERLGWTGDAQVFTPTALFLFNVGGFLKSWLDDLAAEQYADGGVPHVVPTPIPGGKDPIAAAWGDAATIVPWQIYQRTGDKDILSRQFSSMKAWVDRIATTAGDTFLWKGGFQFGDWLDPTAAPEKPGLAKANPEVVATAHFAHSAWIAARTAEIIGDTVAAEQYQILSDNVKEAFVKNYVTDAGLIMSDAQTVYALALEWDLLNTERQKEGARERLADLVRLSGFRVSTGFVGTPLICDALTNAGYNDLAERLLMQTECPSWLYPVSMGATTIWERWDSMLPDGSINPGEMTSFNHYALGAVADWMHRRIGGIAPLAPGYQRVEIRPEYFQKIFSGAARHISPYGEISVKWHRNEQSFHLEADIPFGVQASVKLPGHDYFANVSNGHFDWEVPMVAAPKEITKTIRDLVDKQAAWEALVHATESMGVCPGGEARVLEIVTNYLDYPVQELFSIIALQTNRADCPVDNAHPLAKEVEKILSEI